MKNICQHCENWFEPYAAEDGRIKTCRQGCEQWAAHEREKAARQEALRITLAGQPRQNRVIEKKAKQNNKDYYRRQR